MFLLKRHTKYLPVARSTRAVCFSSFLLSFLAVSLRLAVAFVRLFIVFRSKLSVSVHSFVRSSALVSVYLIVCSAFDCAVATNYVVRLLPNVREYLAICAIARCCFVCFVCIFFLHCSWYFSVAQTCIITYTRSKSRRNESSIQTRSTQPSIRDRI